MSCEAGHPHAATSRPFLWRLVRARPLFPPLHLFLVPVPVFNARLEWLCTTTAHALSCHVLKPSPPSTTTGYKLPTSKSAHPRSVLDLQSQAPTMPFSDIYGTTPTPLPEGYVRRRRLSSTSGRRAIVVVDPLSSGALLAQVCVTLSPLLPSRGSFAGVLPL